MRLTSEFLDGDAGVGTCVLCLKEHVSLTDEHIFPHSFGGKIECRFLCESCNRKMGEIDKDFSRGMIPRLHGIISGTKRRVSPQEFFGNFTAKPFNATRDVVPSLEGCKIAYEIACFHFGLKYAKESCEAMQLRRSLLARNEQDSKGLVLPLIESELPQLANSITSDMMWATEFHGLAIVSLLGVTQGVIIEKTDRRFRTSIDNADLFLAPRKKGGKAMIVPLCEWYKTHSLNISEIGGLLEKLCGS